MLRIKCDTSSPVVSAIGKITEVNTQARGNTLQNAVALPECASGSRMSVCHVVEPAHGLLNLPDRALQIGEDGMSGVFAGPRWPAGKMTKNSGCRLHNVMEDAPPRSHCSDPHDVWCLRKTCKEGAGGTNTHEGHTGAELRATTGMWA